MTQRYHMLLNNKPAARLSLDSIAAGLLSVFYLVHPSTLLAVLTRASTFSVLSRLALSLLVIIFDLSTHKRILLGSDRC